MAAYSIANGRTAEHAAELARGLELLGASFSARLCGCCGGRGEYEQTFTAGCGMGRYRSMGGCDTCDGTGLMQGDKPAPASVRNQVLTASRRSAA